MQTAIITLSARGAKIARRLAKAMPGSRIFTHHAAGGAKNAEHFRRIIELTGNIFCHFDNIIFIAPCGVAVRAIAPFIADKRTDPAVVVVDVGARYCLSLLSGHEGGANRLAFLVANILGAEPVITTTSEAGRDIIVGIGCRRGARAAAIIKAVRQALRRAGRRIGDVRCLATADIKRAEKGLREAAQQLDRPLRIIGSAEIRRCRSGFGVSKFVRRKTGLPAVAEPAALLAGRRTTLALKKQVFAPGITVALARESFIS